MNPYRRTLAFLTVATGLASPAMALEPLVAPTLTIDPAAAMKPDPAAQPPAGSPATDQKSPSDLRPTYGFSGAQAWTFGGLYANDFKGDNDFNLHVAYSIFLADNFEFAVEVGGWYFDQSDDRTGGVSGSMIFRWHFWHDEDYKTSVFADAGIGILGAFDNVPNGGTSFDFLPRLGGGFTHRLGDEPNSPRLMVGVRWHHISNARIEGDSRNPARDSLAGYIAIVFPF